MAKDILASPGISGFKFSGASAGDVISGLFTVGYTIVGFLAFFWFVWGAFQYILAKGDKEQLARARARIIWAIIGLVLFALAYSLTQFAQDIFPSKTPSPISLIPTAYAQVDIGKEFGFGNEKNGDPVTLGSQISKLVDPAFSIAVVLVIGYFLYGAFVILKSKGDKNEVASGRETITHAIIGFILLMAAFLALNYIMSYLFQIDNFSLIKGL